MTQEESPRVHFWRAKLATAQAAHKAEIRKMSQKPGASLRELGRHSRAIDRAERELKRTLTRDESAAVSAAVSDDRSSPEQEGTG